MLQDELDKENINRNDEIIRILNKVYQYFIDGLFDEAVLALEEALKINYEYEGITSALKYANFWKERLIRLEEIFDNYERGEFLIKQWEQFSRFISQAGGISEKGLFNLKQFVYAQALENYRLLLEDADFLDYEILLKIGRCHKGLGNYEKAIEYMEAAMQEKPGSAEIMAEVADCYSLINDIRLSKIFFREAFFIDPGTVNIHSLESGMIRKLIEKIKERGIPEAKINAWIPVYGTIFGVFNIKRELKSLEIGKLKQAVYQLEKAFNSTSESISDLIPKLINHYFWLIDHYLSSGEDKSKIEEILLKIRDLDFTIYKEYTN